MTTETDSTAQGTGVADADVAPAEREDWFGGERHVYEPHRVGLPPFRQYLRELWRRRAFAVEGQRATLRAQHGGALVSTGIALTRAARRGSEVPVNPLGTAVTCQQLFSRRLVSRQPFSAGVPAACGERQQQAGRGAAPLGDPTRLKEAG